MNNIFEGAYFGKPYRTRDGRKAIYITHADDRYDIALEGSCGTFSFLLRDGILVSYANFDNIYNQRYIDTMIGSDIISEWQEEINEEELDKLGNEYLKSLEGKSFNYIPIKDSFKAGYRKALIK